MEKRFEPAKVVKDVIGTSWAAWCPKCGAPEDHPNQPGKVLIRGYKMSDQWGRWFSQCLVCASTTGPGGYNDDLTAWLGPLTEEQAHQGWFTDDPLPAAVEYDQVAKFYETRAMTNATAEGVWETLNNLWKEMTDEERASRMFPDGL